MPEVTVMDEKTALANNLLLASGMPVSPPFRRAKWVNPGCVRSRLIVAAATLLGVFLLFTAIDNLDIRDKYANDVPTGTDFVYPGRHEHGIEEFTTPTSFPTLHLPRRPPRGAPHWRELTKRQTNQPPPPPANASANPLQTFQVDVPLLGPGGTVVGAGTPGAFREIETTVPGDIAGCEVVLAVNVFNNSFETPFVGQYEPPACLADTNTVVMNLTVTSRGRQFDRLSIIYLGDTEIFRTSTEEPRAQGIAYTYIKDTSQYMALWKQPQKVIFDLPNLTNVNLTGTFNTTLTASFFNAPKAILPADTIIPISRRRSNTSQPSVFAIPDPDPSASNLVTNFPRNAARAVFSVSATGQGNEEFWWTNVLSSATATYNASGATLPGFSPFREVQVLIDGQLAGVQWPFPVIFTGGVVPSFWNPMVGIDTFDLKEGEIDISPWLGVLCDGLPHNFSINVVGLDDNAGRTATLSKGVGSNWQVTGKIFIWLDESPTAITTGAPPTFAGIDPIIEVTQTISTNATGGNDTLRYSTAINRQFTVSSTITTSTGQQSLSWSQTLSHTDGGTVTDFGASQVNSITTQGTDVSTYPGSPGGFTTSYSYPLNANVSAEFLSNGTTRLAATLTRTKTIHRTVTSADGGNGGAIAPSGLQLFAALPATSDLVGGLTAISWTTTQDGAAVLLLFPNGTNAAFGEQSQALRFGGGNVGGEGWLGMEADEELYFRDVQVNSTGTVLGDVERLVGVDLVGKRPPAIGLGGSVALVGGGMMVEGMVDGTAGGASGRFGDEQLGSG